MGVLAVLAPLEFLSWRDAQMAAISGQLEDAFPTLLNELDKLTETESLASVVVATARIEAAARETIKTWSDEQMRIALERAKADLDNTLSSFQTDLEVRSNSWDSLQTFLPAAAGIGLLAGSVAAIPTVISFATITTTSLFFFTTATVSVPLLALGGAGLAAASFVGSSALTRAATRARASLRRRLREEAARKIFGTGLEPDARCLHNDLQAAAIRAGIARLQEAV